MKKFIQGDVSKLLDHEGVTSNKEIGFQVQAPKLAQTIMKQCAPAWAALKLSDSPDLPQSRPQQWFTDARLRC